MIYLRNSILIICIISFAACNSTQYISDNITLIDRSQFESYVLEENCGDDINPVMQIRINNAVQISLKEKGMSYDENADLLVKYFVNNKQQKYVQECRDDYLRWQGGRKCIDRVITYEEGSIVIDMIDTRSNSIIWHGAAFGPSWNRLNDPNKHVNKTVQNLISRFYDAE